MSNFRQVTPFMLVRDLDAAVAFFTDVLGFKAWPGPPDYAYVHRETVGFRILQAQEGDLRPGNRHYAYYIDVEDVDALYAELKDKLATLPPDSFKPPADREYGQREMLVLAPDDAFIAFGQDISG